MGLLGTERSRGLDCSQHSSRVFLILLCLFLSQKGTFASKEERAALRLHDDWYVSVDGVWTA